MACLRGPAAHGALLVQLLLQLLQRVLGLAVLHLRHQVLGLAPQLVQLARLQVQQHCRYACQRKRWSVILLNYN